MANKDSALFQVLIVCSSFLLIIFPQNSCDAHNVFELKHCGFNAIYSLGASMSDTGNSIVGFPFIWQAKLPYGKTIHQPTGRSSDGLLIIDYIAKSADLPLVEPYKNLSAKHLSTCCGVNFAVAGATTLSKEVLAKKNITQQYVNTSLSVELGWLDDYLKLYCHNVKACKKVLKSSLFMISFGFNDYSSAFNQNHTIEEIKKNGLVIEVVKSIKHAVSKVIHRGAKKVLVFGLSQEGCRPSSVAAQSANKSAAYDGFGCAKDINDFCMYHNELLQKGLKKLRNKHPSAQIVYGDLYNAMQSILDNFQSLGFKSLSTACCDVKNKDKVTAPQDKLCGAVGTTVCPKIEEYVYWDHAHWTQKTNELLANWIIQGIFPKFQCNA